VGAEMCVSLALCYPHTATLMMTSVDGGVVLDTRREAVCHLSPPLMHSPSRAYVSLPRHSTGLSLLVAVPFAAEITPAAGEKWCVCNEVFCL